MIFRNGLLLSLFAVFLQIAVFLQPLLPKDFQISPICETITLALTNVVTADHSAHEHSHHSNSVVEKPSHTHHEHDANHQCQYCTVYANLVLPPEHGVKEILAKINVQWIWLNHTFERVYFALQRLFLLPQGRAPPLALS